MQLPDIILKRIDHLTENIRALLHVYMLWFTFYWTLNGVALAWFVTKQPSGATAVQSDRDTSALVLWFFTGMSLPSAASCFWVLHAVITMRCEIKALNICLLNAIVPPPTGTCVNLLNEASWPRLVTVWGLSINGVTTIALGVIWLFLALFA